MRFTAPEAAVVQLYWPLIGERNSDGAQRQSLRWVLSRAQ